MFWCRYVWEREVSATLCGILSSLNLGLIEIDKAFVLIFIHQTEWSCKSLMLLAEEITYILERTHEKFCFQKKKLAGNA